MKRFHSATLNSKGKKEMAIVLTFKTIKELNEYFEALTKIGKDGLYLW
jgi:hypothetical protein